MTLLGPASESPSVVEPPPAAAPPVEVGAEDDVEARADALVQQGRLDEAFELLEQAYYEQDPAEPRLLFGMGVIELERGNCEAAVGYLGRFLATDPAPKAAASAREVIGYCEAELRADSEAEAKVEVEGPPAPAPDASSDRDAPENNALPDPGADPPSRRDHAWVRDGLAWGLVGTGVTVSAVGAGLLVQARSDVRAAQRAADEASFDRELERVGALRTTGGLLIGAGVAVLAGAAVRYGVLARRRSRVSLAASLGARRASMRLTLRF